MILLVGFAIGWFSKGLNTTTKVIQYQDKLQQKVDQQINKSENGHEKHALIQILIENSPDFVFFEEDFDYNQQSIDYLGKIGHYKVIKYKAEFGSSSKGNYKVIFFNEDNSFYGFYQIFMDLGQVYPTDNDSLQIYHLGIDMKSALPDSLQFGPELWIELNKK